MGEDYAGSGYGRSSEMDSKDGMPSGERRGRHLDDSEEIEHGELQESGRHHKSNKSGQKEEKEYRSRDQERSKSSGAPREKKDPDKDGNSSRDQRKDDRDEREKDKHRTKDRGKDSGREKHREPSRDKDRKDRENERDSEHRRDKKYGKDGDLKRDKDKEREKIRGKEKDREKERDRKKDREPEIHKEKDRAREYGRDRGRDSAEREKFRDRNKENEMHVDQPVNRENDRHGSTHTQRDGSNGRNEDIDKYGLSKLEDDFSRDKQPLVEPSDNSSFEPETRIVSKEEKSDTNTRTSTSEIEERIQRMKEERLAKSSEGASEVLSWVSKSRKLEDKMKAEKEKALRLSKTFEEQDNINDEESDEEAPQTDLGGVRVLQHGLERVAEGGAIVLTLKDQSILADGDINQETDVLENVEIGEQKRREEAYKAAKKKTSLYDDKFSDEAANEKRILPQYDDPVVDEWMTLDSSGRFTAEADRKLEELRKRLHGASTRFKGEDLNFSTKVSSDYYTEEEMVAKFKKPKKKKAMRKKEKLDLDALEAEAIISGLGSNDLGSRDDGRRQNLREKEEMIHAEMKNKAYQLAYAKADEASKALRLMQGTHTQGKEDDDLAFADDDDDLQKSLQRARKIALEKKPENEKPPLLINILSATSSSNLEANNLSMGGGDQQENKVVFTEMEEFVWGLQLDEEENKPKGEDVFMEEDEKPIIASDGDAMEVEDESSKWAKVTETAQEAPAESKEEVIPDSTIHEASVGKGLAGALKLLKDRGTLKENVEWGGRNMDKKRSKLSEIHGSDEAREIRIERTDEYGRTMTPKESFRQLSHKFHGKGPGKMKLEKRMRQYQEELKVKRMKNADTPSLSVERMREAQAKLQTPYLVLSGHAKPGQSNDPGSFAPDDFSGGLTPMLGDKKVEHFLNIKRKPGP